MDLDSAAAESLELMQREFGLSLISVDWISHFFIIYSS